MPYFFFIACVLVLLWLLIRCFFSTNPYFPLKYFCHRLFLISLLFFAAFFLFFMLCAVFVVIVAAASAAGATPKFFYFGCGFRFIYCSFYIQKSVVTTCFVFDFFFVSFSVSSSFFGTDTETTIQKSTERNLYAFPVGQINCLFVWKYWWFLFVCKCKRIYVICGWCNWSCRERHTLCIHAFFILFFCFLHKIFSTRNLDYLFIYKYVFLWHFAVRLCFIFHFFLLLLAKLYVRTIPCSIMLRFSSSL